MPHHGMHLQRAKGLATSSPCPHECPMEAHAPASAQAACIKPKTAEKSFMNIGQTEMRVRCDAGEEQAQNSTGLALSCSPMPTTLRPAAGLQHLPLLAQHALSSQAPSAGVLAACGQR